ncbi:MAG: hypothetical protein WC455_18340 [Dehalococcoidia bacterium]|jgi:hypothetical protein
MAIVKPLMARPFEYIAPLTGNAFVVVEGGNTYESGSFLSGTFANIASLARELCYFVNVLSNGDLLLDYAMIPETSGLCTGPTVALTADHVCSVIWVDTRLRDALGFTDSPTNVPSTGYTIGTKPAGELLPDGPYFWVPSYGPSDRRNWSSRTGDCVVGSTSQNGTWAGTATGSVLYYYTVSMPLNLTADIMETGQAVSTEYTSLEAFLRNSLGAQTHMGATASCKGFWWYPNQNLFFDPDCHGVHDADPNRWSVSTGTGIQFAAGIHWRCFCHAEKDSLPAFDDAPAQAMSRLRYDYQFTMHTAVTPSFRVYEPIIVV